MSRVTYLQLTEMRLLQAWGREVSEMFRGHMPYLVGSATTSPDYRDVDVRLMLPDAHYAKLKKRVNIQMLGLTVALWGQRVTGLPIDFQIQQRTAANEKYSLPRHPLAMPRDEYDA